MKKFLTLALALVMALALAAPAMAFSSTGAADLTLENYGFDFYFVDYERNNYFGGEDIIVTDLPEADKGFVTNEVLAALIELVVPKESSPDGDVEVYVTGEGVKFLDTDEPAIPNAAVINKAEDNFPTTGTYTALTAAGWTISTTDDGVVENADGDEFYVYDLIYDDDDEQWSILWTEDLFEGDNKDRTLQWLIFAKVEEDEAYLKLTVELDGEASEKLVLEADQGDAVTTLVTSIDIESGREEFTVSAQRVDTAGTAFEAIAGVDTGSDGFLDADVPAAAGYYKIEQDGRDNLAVYIVYDASYRARVMLVEDNTGGATAGWYAVDKDGDLHFLDDMAAIDDVLTFTDGDATNPTSVLTSSKAYDVVVAKNGVGNVVGGTGSEGLTKAKSLTNLLADVCDAFNLDPANANRKMKPDFFSVAGSAEETIELVLDIEPWTAYVTIPDVEVIDPPQTGDAATLAGFVMILVAAAGVVVFKKVRA